jgi:hypothetical protein
VNRQSEVIGVITFKIVGGENLNFAIPVNYLRGVTGTSKVIRRDGDRLYVETVRPDAARNLGCFTLGELQKKGDLYTGTVREGCVCQYGYKTNRYTVEAPIEISKMIPTRIEGRAAVPPNGTKIDCKKGTYSKPASEWPMVPFTWIPE